MNNLNLLSVLLISCVSLWLTGCRKPEKTDPVKPENQHAPQGRKPEKDRVPASDQLARVAVGAPRGQKPEKAQHRLPHSGVSFPVWEYKICKLTDADFANDKVEAQFNKLATEGWEFVETIVSRSFGDSLRGGRSPIAATTCVLFKRLK